MDSIVKHKVSETTMNQKLNNYADEIQHEVNNKKPRIKNIEACKNIAKGTIAYHEKENERKKKITRFINNLLHRRGYNYDVKLIRRKK